MRCHPLSRNPRIEAAQRGATPQFRAQRGFSVPKRGNLCDGDWVESRHTRKVSLSANPVINFSVGRWLTADPRKEKPRRDDAGASYLYEISQVAALG